MRYINNKQCYTIGTSQKKKKKKNYDINNLCFLLHYNEVSDDALHYKNEKSVD